MVDTLDSTMQPSNGTTAEPSFELRTLAEMIHPRNEYNMRSVRCAAKRCKTFSQKRLDEVRQTLRAGRVT